jgi:hypothetical protein
VRPAAQSAGKGEGASDAIPAMQEEVAVKIAKLVFAS